MWSQSDIEIVNKHFELSMGYPSTKVKGTFVSKILRKGTLDDEVEFTASLEK